MNSPWALMMPRWWRSPRSSAGWQADNRTEDNRRSSSDLMSLRLPGGLDDQSRGKKGASHLYATVRCFENVTDPREVARRVNEGLVPLISQIPGCLAYSWVDAGGGVMVSIN